MRPSGRTSPSSDSTTIQLVTPLFERPTGNITALKWRGPDTLMVADDQGRAWTVPVSE